MKTPYGWDERFIPYRYSWISELYFLVQAKEKGDFELLR